MSRSYTHVQGLLPSVLAMKEEGYTYRQIANRFSLTKEPMEVSADPMKDELQSKLEGIEAGKPETYKGQLREILANPSIFGSDLCAAGLADRIEQMFVEELAGAGAVRATLHKYISK